MNRIFPTSYNATNKACDDVPRKKKIPSCLKVVFSSVKRCVDKVRVSERHDNHSSDHQTSSTTGKFMKFCSFTRTSSPMTNSSVRQLAAEGKQGIHNGVKRVEPLCGSERFLDSLSRIPFRNPTTNEKWVRPEFHGLENSPRIIPAYYMGTNMKNNVLSIDYRDMIMDDIRNMRPLNPTQLNYIFEKMDDVEKLSIIKEFNHVMQVYCETVE